jgi:hypothetical protein
LTLALVVVPGADVPTEVGALTALVAVPASLVGVVADVDAADAPAFVGAVVAAPEPP